MEKTYEICFYGGLVLAIVALVAAIILFFVLNIPKVIGELTGHAAKKSMKEMKEGAVRTDGVAKKEQEKYYNMGTGKITAKDAVSMDKRKANGDNSTELLGRKTKYNPDTESTDILRPDGSYEDEEATAVLSDGDEDEATDILTSDMEGDDGATDILTSDEGDDGATDILTSNEGDDGATDILTSDEGDDGATDILISDEGDDGATDILTSDDADEEDEATAVLRSDKVEEIPDDDDEEGTSVLTSGANNAKSKKVRVIYNVVVTHTDERL